MKFFPDDKNSATTSAEVKFLHCSCGYWKFPKTDDIKIIDVDYFFIGLCTPSEIRKRRYKLKEDESVSENIKFSKMFNHICIYISLNIIEHFVFF